MATAHRTLPLAATVLWLCLLPHAEALRCAKPPSFYAPSRSAAISTSRVATPLMDAAGGMSARIAKLEKAIDELETLGCKEEVLEPLRAELRKLKIDDIQDQLNDLKSAKAAAAASPPSPAPPPAKTAPPASVLSTDLGELVERIGDLSYGIDGLIKQMKGGGATDKNLERLQSMRSERMSGLERLRSADAKVYKQTVMLLKQTAGLRDDDLPPTTSTQEATTDDDDENVVIIGGKRYGLRPPPPAPPPAPAPAPNPVGDVLSFGASLFGLAPPPPPLTPEQKEARAKELQAREERRRAADKEAAERAAERARASEEARIAAERATAERNAAYAKQLAAERKVKASAAIANALRAVDYGERVDPRGIAELQRAIADARAAELPDTDIARAEAIEKLVSQKYADIVEAERLAREREEAERVAKAKAEAERIARERAEAARIVREKEEAARKEAARQNELASVKESLRKAIALPGDQRKAAIRKLQVQFHPDRQYQDDESREFAGELSRMVNDAMNVARENEARVEAKKRREAAYSRLMGAMGGRTYGSKEAADSGVQTLREAVEEAKAAGVSEGEVAKGERALAQLIDAEFKSGNWRN